VTQGLCGAVARTGETVLAGDVTKDPRDLATLGSTRSEIAVSIQACGSARVVGLIDVESERLDAGGDRDRAFLEACASELAVLWAASRAA